MQYRITASYPHRSGSYYYQNADQERSLQQGFVKSSGSFLNPLNWKHHFRSCMALHPQRSTHVKPLAATAASNAPVLVIDGADDMIATTQNAQLPQQAWSAIQATVLYPLFLPVIYAGYTGAKEEHEEAKENKEQAKQNMRDAQYMLAQSLDRELTLKNRIIHSIQHSNSDSALSIQEDLRSLAQEHQARTQSNPILEHAPQNLSDEELQRKIALLIYQKKNQSDYFHEVFRCYVSTQLSQIGTGCMFWGIGLYELAAIAQTFSQSALASPLLTAASFAMPIGQAAMALYGICHAISATRDVHHYNQQLHLLHSEKEKLTKGAYRSMHAQLQAQRKHALWGGVIAGTGLAIGQGAMIAGTLVPVLGLPVLAAGAGLTASSIGLRIVSDALYHKRFGYTPNPTFQHDSLDPILEKRQKHLFKLIEYKKLKVLLEAKMQQSEHTQTAQRGWYQFTHRTQQIYMRKYQLELKTMFDASIQNESEKKYLQNLLASSTTREDIMAAMLSRLDPTCKKSDKPFHTIGRYLRNHDHLDQFRQHALKQMLIHGHRRNNQRGEAYAAYIQQHRVYKKRKIHIPLLPWSISLGLKKKTVYTLDAIKLIRDVQKNRLNISHQELKEIVLKAMQKTILKDIKYQERSRLLNTQDQLLQRLEVEQRSQSTRATSSNLRP